MIGKREKRIIRHRRVRAKVKGTAKRPRLSVFRSNRHLHMQLIDDETGRTLASASTAKLDKKVKVAERAAAAGEAIAKKALAAGIKQVVFDRGGHKYHGQLKTAADSMRKAGLII